LLRFAFKDMNMTLKMNGWKRFLFVDISCVLYTQVSCKGSEDNLVCNADLESIGSQNVRWLYLEWHL